MAIEATYLCPLIQVFDMPTSLRFYRDVLGFCIVEHSGGSADRHDWVRLRMGSADLMLNTAYEQPERPARPDSTRVAWHVDTCLYIGCADVDAAFRHVRERGYEAKVPTIAPYGMKQLYLTDPDGFSVCFQQPAQ